MTANEIEGCLHREGRHRGIGYVIQPACPLIHLKSDGLLSLPYST
jgi:hypothetical protein